MDYFARFFVDDETGKECAKGTVQCPKVKLEDLKDDAAIISEKIREMPEDCHKYAGMTIRVDTSTLYTSKNAVQFPDFLYPVKYLGNIRIS